MRTLVALLLVAQLSVLSASAQQRPRKQHKAHFKPPAAKGQQTAGPQQEEKIELPKGPMRIEPFMITETRIRNLQKNDGVGSGSSLRFQVTLTGHRLPEIVGLGNLIIERMVDDKGEVLASLDDFSERQREGTAPVRISKRVLKRGLIHRVAEVKIPSRQATRIAEVRGWVNLVYATETEQIMIDNPLQFQGGYIQHPRLEELGLKIKVVKPSEEVSKRSQKPGIALQFSDNRKHIRKVEFFDAWLKPLYPRQHTVTPDEGEPYIYYEPMVGQIDADTQMVLTVYPKIEEQKLEFEFKDIELP